MPTGFEPPWSHQFVYSRIIFHSFFCCCYFFALSTSFAVRGQSTESMASISVGSLLGVAGGAAGAASYHLYDEKNMAPFRLFCLCAAGLSCIGFWYTGTRLNLDRLDGFKNEVRGRSTVEGQGGEGMCTRGGQGESIVFKTHITETRFPLSEGLCRPTFPSHMILSSGSYPTDSAFNVYPRAVLERLSPVNGPAEYSLPHPGPALPRGAEP